MSTTPSTPEIPEEFENWISDWLRANVVTQADEHEDIDVTLDRHNAKTTWARAIAIAAYRHLRTEWMDKIMADQEPTISEDYHQPFERFKELMYFIEQMASSGMIPHGSGWTSFLYELNLVCKLASAQPAKGLGWVKAEERLPDGKRLRYVMRFPGLQDEYRQASAFEIDQYVKDEYAVEWLDEGIPAASPLEVKDRLKDMDPEAPTPYQSALLYAQGEVDHCPYNIQQYWKGYLAGLQACDEWIPEAPSKEETGKIKSMEFTNSGRFEPASPSMLGDKEWDTMSDREKMEKVFGAAKDDHSDDEGLHDGFCEDHSRAYNGQCPDCAREDGDLLSAPTPK